MLETLAQGPVRGRAVSKLNSRATAKVIGISDLRLKSFRPETGGRLRNIATFGRSCAHTFAQPCVTYRSNNDRSSLTASVAFTPQH